MVVKKGPGDFPWQVPEVAAAHMGVAIQRRCLLAGIVYWFFVRYLHPTLPILPAENEIYHKLPQHPILSSRKLKFQSPAQKSQIKISSTK